MIKLGIDLDDTIINNLFSYDNENHRWRIKKSAKKNLPILYKHFELHVITARSDKFYDEILQIINQIEIKLCIKFTSLTCTNGEIKGKIAHDIGCEYMIDDTIEKLKDCKENSVTGILIYEKKSKKYPDVVCAASWHEVTNFLFKIHNFVLT